MSFQNKNINKLTTQNVKHVKLLFLNKKEKEKRETVSKNSPMNWHIDDKYAIVQFTWFGSEYCGCIN